MLEFNFRKTVARNNFTKIFGRVGARRMVIRHPKKCLMTKRFKLQAIRRAHQGWRNVTFGMLHGLKIRLKYGRRTPIKWYGRTP